MRNRGIELFLLPAVAGASTAPPTAAAAGATSDPTAAPCGQPLAFPGEDGALTAAGHVGPLVRGPLGPSEGGDLQALLAAEGVPGWALPAAMAAAHQAIAQRAATRHRSALECLCALLERVPAGPVVLKLLLHSGFTELSTNATQNLLG